MDDFEILPINLEEDKKDIIKWDEEYFNNENYSNIYKFILEDGAIRNLDELIETNYERYPIGLDETKNIAVIKNKSKDNKDEIIGFMIFQVYGLTSQRSEMFIRYIVINPKYQHQGYGKEILTKMFTNSKKHIGCNPVKVFCYVDPLNFASLNLFFDFGFNFETQFGIDLLKGTAKMPAIENAINKNQFGE